MTHWKQLAAAGAVLLGTAILYPLLSQQSNPKPIQPGVRRDPGLFEGQKKKGEDENVRVVAGTVYDAADNPAEGAIVHIKDVKTLRVRSFITKADGRYRFHGLSTNVDYELTARQKEMESDRKTLSVYDDRKEAVLNLRLDKKAEAEKGKSE